jgi:hypothetical protein
MRTFSKWLDAMHELALQINDVFDLEASVFGIEYARRTLHHRGTGWTRTLEEKKVRR